MKYVLLVLLLVTTAQAAPKFELMDGDRVVFIGNAFIERDIHHNYLETLLTTTYPDRNITFRNMGWSGDTVFVPARAGSGPNKGVELLVEYVKELRPTVLFIAYGMNESFEGEAGLSRFSDGYNKLLDALAPTKARLVLISPIKHENLGSPLPDPSRHNQQLKMYSDAIKAIAQKREALFVDLFSTLAPGPQRLTDNGIHLNQYGYWRAAKEMALQLDVQNVVLDNIDEQGRFTSEHLEKLRQAIRQKNIFFFDRYRPQNDMYIFHGRKHEQGRNAVEIPQFDKFIAEKEAEIARLKRAK